MAESILETFGKAFVPESIFGKPVRSVLRKYLIKAGYWKVPYSLFGLLFFLTAGLTYFIFIPFIYPWLQTKGALMVFFGSFVSWFLVQSALVLVIILGITFFLNIRIYKRTKELEAMLADFLILVSTNLKGGLSLEQALWAAIRPEFGLLAEEMTIVSKRVMTGNDLKEALKDFLFKYDSPALQRNLTLIIGEVESGGKIVGVIDKVIHSLKRTKALKAEMTAATVSYMIFIGAVVVAVAPALFALAFQLLNIITSFTSSLGDSLAGASTSIAIPIDFSAEVETDNFRTFSVMALATISICSSMIISIIEKGDIRGGIKYIPLFTLTSIALYFIAMVVLGNLFGNIL
jgi:pilus assembly protein TadC